MMQRLDQRQKRPAGFALVITVVILALLTIMAVAFLSGTTSERAISRASVNKTKSELAAKMAVNVAIARLIETVSAFPDSATSWESVNQANGSLHYQGTTIYYRDLTPDATAAGTPSPLHALPLISGAQAVQIPYGAQTAAGRELTLRGALPVLDTTNSYDLNHARSAGDILGWIGSSPTWTMLVPSPTNPQPFRAQWVNQTDSDNKITGRYAYWTEDESFKANVNQLGATPRGSNTLGSAPAQIPLQGLLETVLASPAPTPSDYTLIANDIVASRNTHPSSVFFEYRALNQVKKQDSTFDFSNLADTSKFCATVYSGTSNLSRNGSKRVNLNKVVSDSIDPTAIRKQLDQIIKSITYHAPNFAQRFYRTGADKNSLDVPDTASPSHRTIYLNKIAANIRDYIDTDSQPTIVKNDAGNTIDIGVVPAHPIETTGGGTAGANEVIAIGKERVPFVQEYVLRVREVAFSPRLGAFANYTISIDHYVEFWNTSNKDIPLSALGPNPFLLIADQPGWDAGGLSDIPAGASRDVKLYLKDAKPSDPNADPNAQITFPAGSVTVITTDLQPLSTQGSASPVQTGPLTPDLTRVFFIPVTPAGLRTYSGQTQKKSSSELRLNLITRTTSQTDYETEIVLGNDLGILESAWGAGAIGATISVNIDNKTPAENRLDDTKYHFRGASLRGNNTNPLATTGDPRTNAEQINFDLNGAAANSDKTRYYDEGLDSANVPGNSSLGAPNSVNVNPSIWSDPSSSAQSASAAPSVIANMSITSIGQLGDIFDPVRTKGDSNNILLSRSGGRALRIGQPERFDAAINPSGLWDGSSNSASREWAAWRLTDIFCTSDLVQLDGQININGVNRDGGAAFKTALYGYTFQVTPDSDPKVASQPFTTDSVNRLVGEMQDRLKNDPTRYTNAFANTAGPFMEKGEISEMPIFNSNATNPAPPPATDDLSAGVTTSTVFDRGREELFRRIAELITTRGNIFTVYAVGQSLNPQSVGAPIVTSTSQLKVTFRIDPVWNAGTPADPFDPTTTTRFAKPDHYAIKILYAGE